MPTRLTYWSAVCVLVLATSACSSASQADREGTDHCFDGWSRRATIRYEHPARRVTLDGCASVTNAGLISLKPLVHLEELNLKGTQVTDAGVQEFLKAQGQTKITR